MCSAGKIGGCNCAPTSSFERLIRHLSDSTPVTHSDASRHTAHEERVTTSQSDRVVGVQVLGLVHASAVVVPYRLRPFCEWRAGRPSQYRQALTYGAP
jgi:hypothetical protein